MAEGLPGSAGQRLLWSKSYDMGKRWYRDQVTVYVDLTSQQYQLIWEAVKGDSYRGDIALDDISIADGNCQAPSNLLLIYLLFINCFLLIYFIS